MLPPNSGPTLAAVAGLDAAIAAAFPQFGSLAKDTTADIKGRKHGYLSLQALYEAIRGPLAAQGVVITSTIAHVGGGFVVITMLRHNGGGWRSSEFPVLNMNSASAVAAAGTTAPRINLQLLLGICAQDEEDPPATATGGGWAVTPAGGQAPAAPAIAPAVYADPGAFGQQPAPAAPQAQPQVQPWDHPAPAGQVYPQWQPPAAGAQWQPPAGAPLATHNLAQHMPPLQQPTQSPI